MKGQTALEYLMVFSFSLILISIISFYALDHINKSKTDISITDAQKAANQIAEAADIVYSHGEPSKLTLKIYVPENVKEIRIQNNTIKFVMQTKSGLNDVFSISRAILTGSFSNQQGVHSIKVEASDGHVKIYE